MTNFRGTDMASYNIDITMTDRCNFKCKYCFEKGHFRPKDLNDEALNLIIKRLGELLESKFFKSNFNSLVINFWGGEPTLNSVGMIRMIDKFALDNRVRFLIYTNGYEMNSVFECLDKYKNIRVIDNFPKIITQISYDGNPIHDYLRKHKNNVPTANKVKDNIYLLANNGIPVAIKSTIVPRHFKYMYKAYSEIKEMFEVCNKDNPYLILRYKPTIDQTLVDERAEPFFRNYKSLEESLIKIANKEISFFRKYGWFMFVWFDFDKALCSSGCNMSCIDLSGDIYKCHGCLYSCNSFDHLISGIDEDSMIQDLESSYHLHSSILNYEPLECRECESTFCLRCNSVKYDMSLKDKYIKRWTDYLAQSQLCSYYKLNGKIRLAMSEFLGG